MSAICTSYLSHPLYAPYTIHICRMHYSCMLVSHVCQPCLLIVLPTFRVCQTQPHISWHCNVSFGLAVGEGILDLRLPSVSRILDFYVMVLVLCYAFFDSFI